MKLAVSSSGPGLDDHVDERFGRCPCFVIVDPETMAHSSLDNSGADATSGAGVRAAQTLSDQGVEAVITGTCGPHAFEALRAAGIPVYGGATGTIRDAVAAMRDGELEVTSRPAGRGRRR
jgi:predicted Fe-Mo cluster-binding NifX family protein